MAMIICPECKTELYLKISHIAASFHRTSKEEELQTKSPEEELAEQEDIDNWISENRPAILEMMERSQKH